MQRETTSYEKETIGSEEFEKLSHETALDNIRFYTTNIWQEDPKRCDVLLPVLCNICLKTELLQERLSTVTAADILAGISFENQKESLPENDKEPCNSDEDDFFSSAVFKLKQECVEIPNHLKELDTNQSGFWGDIRTVGYGRNLEPQFESCYEPFDPRLAFAGLQDAVFPNFRFLKPDDEPQENVCLAVNDVSEIVHEYLNKYHDYLTDQRAPSGNWADQPDAILPSKFASFDVWAADKNEIRVDKESNPECRLLAAKVTSHSVRRLWSDSSAYTPSTSDDQEVFSHQDSVSEVSTSPRESANTCHEELYDYSPGFPDALSYPFFQTPSVTECPDEPVSQLWSGRNVDSFKDFIPRLSYGFNLPVPDVVLEKSTVHENTSGDRTGGPSDAKDEKGTSKFFNIWCVSDPDDGQGDGISSRCSERSDSPPGGQSLSEKSSPEAGLQIPRLVSTKRRERPIRGLKNTRRSNVKDYQVTFIDCADKSDKTRYLEPGTVSSSRAAISDTTVWTVKGGDKDMLSAYNSRHGFSKSETHQEFITSRVDNWHLQPTEKIELSAKSEPFFPRAPVPGYPGCASPTGERLNTIDEELLISDVKNSRLDTLEKRNSLSPTCKPFVPRTFKREAEHQENLDPQYKDEEALDIQCHSDNVYNSPEDRKPLAPYVAWSPATDASEDSPVKEYKLFGPSRTIFDEASIGLTNHDKSNTYGSGKKQLEKTDTVNSVTDLQKQTNSERDLVSFWDIWKNSSDTNLGIGDTSWGNLDYTKLEPVTSVQKTSNSSQPNFVAASAQWQGQTQDAWPDVSIQPQFNRVHPLISRNTQCQQSLHHHDGIPSGLEKPELVARVIRPQQSQPQLELKPTLDMLGRGSLVEPRLRQYQTLNPQWTGPERSVLPPTYPQQDGNRFLQSQGVTQVRSNHGVPILSNQVTCLPTPQHYDTAYRKMVVLHPHPKQPDPRSPIHPSVFPRGFVHPPALKPTTFQTLRQPLTPGIQRVPLDQHSRLHPVISRTSTSFGPPAGFAPTVPNQTYRHVTVAANYNQPKLVAVPTFDAHPQPRFFSSYLNFNNHNEDYNSDCDTLEGSVDPVGVYDEDQEPCDRRGRARPIRANPANLIHIT